MWQRLSDWIQGISRGWVTLTGLVIFLLFTALVLPRQTSTMEQDDRDAGSPDMSFYYTSGDLYQMADAYGEVGRRAYVRARFTFDLIWPLIYLMFLTTGISWAYRKAFLSSNLWQRANLVPFIGAVFDYLENVSTSLVMLRYPRPTVVVDVIAGVFTMVKWAFVCGSFLLLILWSVIGIWKRLSVKDKG